MANFKLYTVFYTWVDDRGIKKAGHSNINALSANSAIRTIKREKRPFKLENLVARLHTYPTKWPTKHKAIKEKRILVSYR